MPTNTLMQMTVLDFQTTYREELNYVWHSLRRLGVASAELEDATQDVFVIVHRRLHDFDLTRPVRPWLFGIALRIASERRRQVRPTVPLEADVASDLMLPTDALELKQRQHLVRGALLQLSTEQRAVFILHDLDQCVMPDVAQALEIPLNTAYSRLRLARQAFVKAIRERAEP